jgi:hypothetical protein
VISCLGASETSFVEARVPTISILRPEPEQKLVSLAPVLLLAVLLVSWNGTAWSGAVTGGAVSLVAAERSDVEWKESQQVSVHPPASVATFTVPWHGLASGALATAE